MKSHSLSLVRALGVAGLLGTSFALATPAQAQQSEIDVLRQQIAEMQARLDKLEAAKIDVKAVTPTVASNSKSPLTISGLAQVHLLDFFSEDTANGGARGIETFRLRRGEIRLTAPSITNQISGTIMIDPAKTTTNRTDAGAATGTIRRRDNILQEIQLSYSLFKRPNGDSLGVDVGQYKIPIGYESLVSSGALPNVERALLFTQRDPFDGAYGDVRDTGIQLRGTTIGNQLEYRLGVFNGFGDRQNGLALSDAKAVMGRLLYRPASVPGLEVGGSYARGKTGVEDIGNPRDKREIQNLFANYKRGKLQLLGEFLKGEAAPIIVSGATKAGRDIQGYYGHIGYYLAPQLEITGRYDFFDSNRDMDNASVKDITLGLNYYLKGNNAKIQTNLVKRNAEAAAPTALRNERYELRTNFQVAF